MVFVSSHQRKPGIVDVGGWMHPNDETKRTAGNDFSLIAASMNSEPHTEDYHML